MRPPTIAAAHCRMSSAESTPQGRTPADAVPPSRHASGSWGRVGQGVWPALKAQTRCARWRPFVDPSHEGRPGSGPVSPGILASRSFVPALLWRRRDASDFEALGYASVYMMR